MWQCATNGVHNFATYCFCISVLLGRQLRNELCDSVVRLIMISLCLILRELLTELSAYRNKYYL